jgi:lysophospholipase L1-like esterase
MKTKRTIKLLIGILGVPISFLLILSFSVGACKEEISKSDKKDIFSFTLAEENDTASINKTNKTISVTVKYSADLTKLTPQITVSQNAVIVPASGTVVDFSKGPVTYTVIAEDKTTQQWTVTVTKATEMDKKIIAFILAEQVDSALIDNINDSVKITVDSAANVTNLKPKITISSGTIISPASGTAVDFSKGPVKFIITATDGSTKDWMVKVTKIIFIGADNNKIKYVGRIDLKTLTAPRFANPGVYIKASFTGTFCDIDMNDESNLNYISVVIDNQAPVRFLMTQGRHTYRVAGGLSRGAHSILICKDTEHIVGGLSFYGFWCEGLSSVTDMPTRKIECYGESATTGAFMLSGTPCVLAKTSNWQAASSAYLSYGAVAARALNAQWQITAEGGVGLVQSCCSKGYTLPDEYDRLDLNNPDIKWDFSKYIPDVVTICLGSNDGSTIVASQTFKNKYVEFINTIRSRYHDASIFCITSPTADSNNSPTCLFAVEKASLTSIIDSINKAGDTKVYWVKLPHDQFNGCKGQGQANGHPSEAEHAITATVLEAFIKQKMGW